MKNVELGVICAEDCFEHIEAEVIHIESSTKTGYDAAVNRLTILDYPQAWDYDVVLYLDSDIIVTGDLTARMDCARRGYLHVASEGRFTSKLWNIRHHSKRAINRFTRKGLKNFNSGQFLFKPEKNIRKLFHQAVFSSYRNKGNCLEQGHMNDVFLYKGRLCYDLGDCTVLKAAADKHKWKPNAIIHFTGRGTRTSDKLASMNECLEYSARFAGGGHTPTDVLAHP